MGKKADRQALSLGYRILYRVKYIGMHMYGPGELGDQEDPHMRLKRERQAKVDAWRRAQEQTGS